MMNGYEIFPELYFVDRHKSLLYRQICAIMSAQFSIYLEVHRIFRQWEFTKLMVLPELKQSKRVNY